MEWASVSESAGRVSEPAGIASEPAGKGPEPAGRVPEPARRVSEPAVRPRARGPGGHCLKTYEILSTFQLLSFYTIRLIH